MGSQSGDQGEDKDPRREMLELSDTAPREALDWISRLDPDLASDSVVQMAKINALRRAAMGAPGEKSGTSLASLFSEEDREALREALETISQLQESDPEYFETQTGDDAEANHPISSVLCAAEAVWPGSVQQFLGWTRLKYFEPKQLGFAPGLIEKLPLPFRTTVYDFKLKNLPLFKSALAIFFNPRSEQLSLWLLEEDMRHTESVGAAGILGTLTLSADGSYRFSQEDSEFSTNAAVQDVTPTGEEQKSIPWGGFAIAFVLFWLIFGCVREIF